MVIARPELSPVGGPMPLCFKKFEDWPFGELTWSQTPVALLPPLLAGQAPRPEHEDNPNIEGASEPPPVPPPRLRHVARQRHPRPQIAGPHLWAPTHLAARRHLPKPPDTPPPPPVARTRPFGAAAAWSLARMRFALPHAPFSYTHLTLPTILRVSFPFVGRFSHYKRPAQLLHLPIPHKLHHSLFLLSLPKHLPLIPSYDDT